MREPCAYCGAVAEHIDHIIPLSRGGTHSIGNLAPACAKCNLSKANKLLVEWRHPFQRKGSAMTIYRASVQQSVFVEALGRDVNLDPAVALDDQYPDDAAVIKEWAPRGIVRPDNPIEAATAAPGERRAVSRKG